MNLKRIKALLIALVLMLSMTACGEEKKAVTTATKQQDVTTADVSGTKEENSVMYPLEITDSTGATIVLDSKPEKVVSISPSMTEMMFSLGQGDLLVARTDYCDYPLEAANIETVGTLFEPDIEKIITLEPDVILCSSIVSDDLLARLAAVDISVVVLYDDSSYSAVYDIISDLGQIFDCVEKSNEIVTEMKDQVTQVQGNVSDKEKVSVYYAVSFGEYGDYTVTGETYINEMITLAGGENIAKDLVGWTISLEEIIEADPDVILVGQGMAESFTSSEGYKDLTAVKEGKVYEIDVNLLDRQSNRNAEGISLMSQLFYGEE